MKARSVPGDFAVFPQNFKPNLFISGKHCSKSLKARKFCAKRIAPVQAALSKGKFAVMKSLILREEANGDIKVLEFYYSCHQFAGSHKRYRMPLGESGNGIELDPHSPSLYSLARR